MMIPVRCFTCNKVIANRYETYKIMQKEGMSNASIRKAITDIYQADINSIRNLSKLANDLTSNGRLNIPGGLTIQGDLNVGGRVQANVSRKAKDDMFRVFHPDGGYLYFNKAGITYIEKKESIWDML